MLFPIVFCFVSTVSANTPVVSLEAKIETANKMEKIKIYAELAEYYADKDPEKALEYALQTSAMAEQAGIPKIHADGLFLAGNASYHMNNYDDALRYFSLSLDVREKTGDRQGIVAAFNRIGNTYQLKGDYDKALMHYKKALDISSKEQLPKETARSLTNIGSIYQLYGNYTEAIDFYLQAMGRYEEIKDIEGMAWSYLNIARLFKRMAEYPKALDYITKSLTAYEDIAKKTGVNTGITLCIKEKGLIYRQMGDYDKALEYSLKVYELNKKANNEYGVANSLSHLGQIYYEKGDYSQGLQKLTEAIMLKEKLNDQVELATIYRYIGNAYIKKQDIHTALRYLHKSMEKGIEQNLKDEIKESYQSLSAAYAIAGDYKKSLNFYMQYSLLKDSLNINEITRMEMQYDFNKKQKQIEFEQRAKEEQQKARLQRQKIITRTFIISFILVLAFAFLIYKNYQAKKEANLQLSLQNEEIRNQRDKIMQQKKMITDSIQYAQRIQKAILPQENFLNHILPEYFIVFIPRDIVSGDFYWVSKKDDKIIALVADCTGHGVPGAFMSMLGIASLNEIVNKMNITRPDEILNQLRTNIIEALHQTDQGSVSKDGMDIALVSLDTKNNRLEFAGAHNPLLLYRNSELVEIKGNKMPIGIHVVTSEQFTLHDIPTQKGDTLYLFSDGYIDQFGGEKKNKYKLKNFKTLLASIQPCPMNKQKEIIEKTFYEWKGSNNQIDDILVMGIRL